MEFDQFDSCIFGFDPVLNRDSCNRYKDIFNFFLYKIHHFNPPPYIF